MKTQKNLPNKILSDDFNKVTEWVENLMLLVILCNSAPYKLLPDQQTPQCAVCTLWTLKKLFGEGLFSVITKKSLV